MKFTVADVLDAYLVLDDNTGERVSYSEAEEADEEAGEPAIIRVEWASGGLEYTMLVEADQIVDADGDYFTLTDTDGENNMFRAYTIVRLNEVPEFR